MSGVFEVVSMIRSSMARLCAGAQAAELIRTELEELRRSMGHADATVDDYVEAHDACVDDMVYFPARKNFGLASVASAVDRLAALNYELDNTRRHMEGETRKAVRFEQKLKVLTQGYKVSRPFVCCLTRALLSIMLFKQMIFWS